MRKISEDIKNQSFEKIYLLYGEEDYLKRQYRVKLKQAICGDDTMNYSYFEGKSKPVSEVIGIADTMPFFAEHRLVVVENYELFSASKTKGEGAKSGQKAELEEYLKTMPDTTVLVFIEKTADKRSRLFKFVKDNGYICELNAQTPATLATWAASVLKASGKQITGNTIDYFLTMVGNDMSRISNELEKLISYTGDRDVVNREDIDEICSVAVASKIFDMVDAMGSRNRQKALGLYYDMIELKEPPMRILFMLSRQFDCMLRVKELKQKGTDQKTIAAKTGLPPFAVGKTLRQSEQFSGEALCKAIDRCLKLEEDVKNGRLSDKICVELILTEYTKQAEKRTIR